MNQVTLIAPPSAGNSTGTASVDMRVNPLSLGNRKLAFAVNLEFREGTIRTRPGFHYQRLGASGVLQGATHYAPSKGLSAMTFAPELSALVVVIGGRPLIANATDGEVSCLHPMCGSANFHDRGAVWLYQAENYLVAQNPQSNTFFWDGEGCWQKSPGMAGCDTVVDGDCGKVILGDPGAYPDQPEDSPVIPGGYSTSLVPGFSNTVTPLGDCYTVDRLAITGGADCADISESSHDSFCETNHVNWLVNGAGLGIYAHGRIHQEAGGPAIFVSDLVHKRGYMVTSDILLMEEQALESMGDPLTVPSRLGSLKAMAVLPAMSTANGEGELIAYHENGVVSYDTFQTPRETRANGEGEMISKGWSTKRLVTHLLNTISAVGRYAVAVLPRDHVFRSFYGLHFLKTVLGDGSFRPEQINTISQDVQPLLDADPKHMLDGAAVGSWTAGSRIFASTGLFFDECLSVIPLARGFVSMNLATTFTEDRTPRGTTEGLWLFDHDIAGMHQFMQLGVRTTAQSFGMLVADRDADWFFAAIDECSEADYRDDTIIPIEWEAVTGQVWGSSNGFTQINDGVAELILGSGSKVIVEIRTDEHTPWVEWTRFENSGKSALHIEPLGSPPSTSKSGTWFQVRVRGLGYAEIRAIRVSVSSASTKEGQRRKVTIDTAVEDPYLINNKPINTRWNT
jgi:hypothetical protein